MSTIKVMTWNVQLLPDIPPPFSNPGHESLNRSLLVADVILNMSPEELPDVLALNEVFDEMARLMLLSKLGNLYPYRIEKLSTWAVEDSGLMLLSKFPFLKLPIIDNLNENNNYALFYSYPGGATIAEFNAAKGFGVVRIECPLGRIIIGFTHLHAFYQNEWEHADIREKQFSAIENEVLIKLIGPPAQGNKAWEKVIVMGDLNIRGNADGNGLRATEWYNVFRNKSWIFSENFYDGWEQYNRSPDKIESDPGLTNYNLAAGSNLADGIEMRLDYQLFSCVNKSTGVSQGKHIVPQQMKVLHFPSSRSDHKALLAEVNLFSEHCSPSTAIEQRAFNVHQEIFHTCSLVFMHPGSYQWVYISEPGTYTFLPPTGFAMEVYEEDNLSLPVNFFDTGDTNKMELPPVTQDIIKNEFRLVTDGEQYNLRKPSMVLIKGTGATIDFTGSVFFGFIKHNGQNRNLAIFLDPWQEPVLPHLPDDKKNGDHDDCWFRIFIGQALSKVVHPSTITIDNQSGFPASLQLFKDKDTTESSASVSNAAGPLVLTYSTAGNQSAFILLKRDNFSAVKFLASWRSSLTYLAPTPLRVFCKTETSEISASDEIRMRFYADNMPTEFLGCYRDDFDKNEIEFLEDDLKNTGIGNVAFVESIRADFFEADGFLSLNDDGPYTIDIPALPEGKTTEKYYTQEVLIAASGIYRLEYMLKRLPDKYKKK